MIEKNKHINDFLKYYFNLEQSPEYAILIDGEWGAGKSWFIQKALNDLKGSSGKYLYVSLYGMSNFSEIEDAFFEQMHPVLSSRAGLTHQCLYFEQPHTFEQILFIQTAEPALVGHA